MASASSEGESRRLFVFGVTGFVSRRLLSLLDRGEFARVSGSARRGGAPALAAGGPADAVWEGEDGELTPAALEDLRAATHVLSTVPPTEDGRDPVVGFVERLALRGSLVWVGYVSSAAVYAGGELVDENWRTTGGERIGEARRACEARWLACGAPTCVFRLPPVYGPGRGPLLRCRETRRVMVKEGHVLSRVHVEDVAACLLLSMRAPNPGRVYNVCDDEPAPLCDVFDYACEIQGLRPVPRIEWSEVAPSRIVASVWGDSKQRLSNARARRELGFRPRYPSYREGLLAQLAEERGEEPARPPTPLYSSAPPPARRSVASPLPEPARPSDVGKWRATLSRVWSALRAWLARLFVLACFHLLARRSSCVVLLDAGSLRPGATLGMRRLASALARRLGVRVEAASLRHANAIPPQELGGTRAVVAAELRARLSLARPSRVALVPLFLGDAEVLSSDLPRALRAQGLGEDLVARGPPLVSLECDDPSRCAATTCLVRTARSVATPDTVAVVVVDHGSPSPRVTRARRALAARMRRSLYPLRVVDASMERRSGTRFDFNEPLLERVFDLGGLDSGHVVVAPAFLFPGNHAGPGGDLHRIVEDARRARPALRVTVAGLLLDPVNDDVWERELETRSWALLLAA